MKTLFAAAALAAAFLSPMAAAAQSEPRTSIVASDFGIFDVNTGSFTPTRTVSLAKKQDYGWLMLLDTPKAEVRYREEFILPAAGTWNVEGGSDVKVSADRRSAVTERVMKSSDGVIFNVWSVAEGDPKGRYVIKVTVEDQVERTFEFDVE